MISYRRNRGIQIFDCLLTCIIYYFQGGSCTLSSRDDTANYRMLCDALHVLNFSRTEEETIHRILASVLHAGNIFFKRIQVTNMFITVHLMV